MFGRRQGRYLTQTQIAFSAYKTFVLYSPLTCTAPTRCLAHIIILVTQVFISTHSKSKHYNPAESDANLIAGNGCDVVGLVWAISVKVTQIQVAST
jgi:hypothetical protein